MTDIESIFLKWLSQDNSLELSKYIQENPDFIGFKNEDGDSPLMMAAYRGNMHAVDLLVQLGADVDARNCEGQTALMVAAKSGQLAMVNYLLRVGASATATDQGLRSALHWATTEADFPEVCLVLMSKGCSPFAKSKLGKSALEYAQLLKRGRSENVMRS